MKIFLVALTFVVACQAKLTGLCAKPDAADAPLDKITSQTRAFLIDVLEENCKVDGGSFTEYFFKPSTGCADFFQQGYCYFSIEERRTDPIFGLTYDQIKKAIPDVSDLVGFFCTNQCTTNILPKIYKCYMDPATKPLIVKKIAAQFMWAKGEVKKYESILEGTPIGRAISVGLKEYKTWGDVGLSIKFYKRAIVKLISEIRGEFGDFCKAKCYTPTFKHILGLAKSINKGDCEQPRKFCGACQSNAKAYLLDPANKMPCCMKKFYDYIMNRTDTAAKAEKGGNEILLSKIAVLSAGNEDFQCIRSVYDPHRDSLKSECDAI